MMSVARTLPALTKISSFEKGFSIVELMVGLTISLIMFVVIGDVFINFESQKRVTTLSSDTQSSGIMAIFEMEQAIRSAGAGIANEDTFDCVPANTKSYYVNAGPPAIVKDPVPGYGQFFAPVVITNGAGGLSDTLELRVGVPVAKSAPTALQGDFKKAGVEEIGVSRGTGFPVGTVLMIVGPPEPNSTTINCTVVEVTGIPEAGHLNRMSVAPATSGNTWNPSVAYRTTNGWPDFAGGVSHVYAPGVGTGGMYFRTYSVNASGQLQVVSARANEPLATEVLVADVVRLHAQYGVSSAVGVQDIEKWVEPVFGGTYETNWDPASLDADKVKRIKAIRLAIVLRSPKLEGGAVTGVCTTAGGVVNNGPCAWEDTAADPAPQIDLSADANWQRYRYRVFQTIVPIRNVISAGV